MEVINYFKIKSLIEVIIKDIKLKSIFRNRYYSETGKEWVNDKEDLEFVIKRYHNLVSLDLDQTLLIEKEDIKNHNIDCYTYHEFYNILINFKYEKSNIQLLNYQNEIINNINTIHILNILNNNQFKLDNKKFIQLYEQLMEFYNKLSTTALDLNNNYKIDNSNNNNNSLNSTIIDINNNNSSNNLDSSNSTKTTKSITMTISAKTLDIKSPDNSNNNKDNNKLESKLTLEESSNNLKLLLAFINNLKINNEIYNRVVKNQEFGNSLFNIGKFYQAHLIYKNTINIPGLTSNDIKSILYLNSSTSCFEDNKIDGSEHSNKKLFPDNQDFLSIKNSRSNAIQSITFNPFNEKSYARLGIVISKLSDYPLAIELFEASLLFDSSESNKELIGPYLKNTKSKLSIIQRSLNGDGSRNFENETNLILNEVFQVDEILKKNFKDPLTIPYLNTILPKIKNTRDQLINFAGMNETKALHFNISTQVYKILKYYDSGKFPISVSNASTGAPKLSRNECIIALGRLINENTTLAFPYYKIYHDLHKFQNNHHHFKFILALLMKISTLPIPFDKTGIYTNIEIEMHLFNYQVSIAQKHLGELYRHGSYGLDIDIYKSAYYFQKSINNDINICDDYKFNLDSDGYSYVALANIFETGRLNGFHGKITTDISIVNHSDIKNALELYRRGSLINGVDFQKFSKEKFKKLSAKYNNISFYKAQQQNSNNNIISYNSDGSGSSREFKGNSNQNNQNSKNEIALYISNNDYLLSNQELNFQQLNDIFKSSGSQYCKEILDLNSKLEIQFIKPFQEYQASIAKNSEEFSFNEKVELIRPLAEIYCNNINLLWSIRLPELIKTQLNSFLKLLIINNDHFNSYNSININSANNNNSPDCNNSNSNNNNHSNRSNHLNNSLDNYMIVLIIYINLNKFNNDLKHNLINLLNNILSKIKESATTTASSLSRSNTLIYFKSSLHLSVGDIDSALNSILSDEILSSNQIFNYLILNILTFIGPTQHSVTIQDQLKLIESAINYLNQITIADDPSIIFYCHFIINVLCDSDFEFPDKDTLIFKLISKSNSCELSIHPFFISLHQQVLLKLKSITSYLITSKITSNYNNNNFKNLLINNNNK